MEFIITGLFIIFFSYILLYSLYDCLFKRSTIEGLDNGDKKDDNEDDDKEEDKEDKDADAAAKAQEGSAKASEGNSKIEQQNKNSPNATLETGMKIANTSDP
jgi:hypothetical protein